MRTIEYFKSLIKYMDQEIQELKKKLEPYERAGTLEFVSSELVPQDRVYGVNNMYGPDLWIGNHVKLGNQYWKVILSNRTEETVTLRKVSP